jgi:hypothetical protein
MNRPQRQHAHLTEKIATKAARSHKKAGKRAKRWKKWFEQYKPLVEGGAPAEG